MREENRSEIIHDALNLLDDALIEEVEELRGNEFTEEKVSKYNWTKKWVAVAAGICLLVMIGRLGKIEFVELQSEDTHEGVDMQENAEDILTKPETDEAQKDVIDDESADFLEEDLLESTEEATEEIYEDRK